MGRLLLEELDREEPKSNLPTDKVALTDSEAKELIERLEELANSREFVESAYFVESMTSDNAEDEERARQIYISGRKKRGRANVHTSAAWADYKARLGLSGHPFPERRLPKPLTFSRFQEMERTLLSIAGLNPRVVDVVMRSIADRQRQIEELRKRQSALRRGIIRSIVLSPAEALARRFHDREVPKNKLIAAIGIVTDTAVFFTTRDWNVVGTMSYMAGAAVELVSEQR